jgi:predicted dehydrogenase
VTKRLKVGIAGYGVVGKRRQLYIDKNPSLQTVAICDITLENSVNNEDGVNVYKSYLELLKEDLDILFVCLTNDIAPEVTMMGLQSGFHVFCEKPPGRNVQDIEAVRKVEAEFPHLKLKYGFNHRYHESTRKAKELVASGELGKVINIRGVYGKSKIISFKSGWRANRAMAGGGILLDQGIHMLDLYRYFVGEFEEIYSFVDNKFWKHDVEDNAYALMKTREGVVAFINSTATQWRHRFNMEISLERGSITLTGILSGSKSYGAETITVAYRNSEDDESGDPREVTTRHNIDNSWRDEINEFADLIINDTKVVSGSSLDALRTMQLVYSIYCADKEWKEKYNLFV